jgi:hypothetical protein
MVKQTRAVNKKASGGQVNTGRLKLSDIPAIVKTFMPEFQQKIIVGSEEHWEIIADLQKIIETMPRTYQTRNIEENDKIVYLHYFYGESDWYIVEKDKLPDQLQTYGYVILNGDLQNSEWGYVSIEEIKQTGVIELDFFFEPIKFGELRKQWEGEDDEKEIRERDNKSSSGSDMGERVFIYGPNFKGIASDNGAKLTQALLDKGFGTRVNNAGVLFISKKGHIAYVNDNGGELNMGEELSDKHIANIPYYGNVGGEKWVASIETLADAIEADFEEYFDMVDDAYDSPGGAAKPTFKINDPVKFTDPTNGTSYGIIKNITPGTAWYYIEAFSLEHKVKFSVTVSSIVDHWNLEPIDSVDYIRKKRDFEALVKEPEPSGQPGQGGTGGKTEGEQYKDEYDQKRQSLDEFFTPKYVAEIIYKLVKKHGFTGGNCLEPSFGHGVFFDVLTENGIPQKNLYGFELFKDSFEKVKNKYPEANLVGHNFEYEFAKEYSALNRDGIFKTPAFQDASIDLVIGNPPYGTHKSPYSYLWDEYLQVRIEGFFIWLALQKVKQGGLVAFIINSLWLHNGEKYNRQKQSIFEIGELIDAYRLPNGTFRGENRNTDIATDIVIFRKR